LSPARITVIRAGHPQPEACANTPQAAPSRVKVIAAGPVFGTEAFPPDQWSIEAATAFVHRELDRWAKDVRENNIQVEQ